MAFRDDLNAEVNKIFQERWTTRAGRVVPEPDNLKLANDAVKLHGTVLYADLDESTALVNTKTAMFAAEIYKTYLVCAARIIRNEGGAITGYDGDRIMAVFVGERRNSVAARAGLKINYTVLKIINPAIKSVYKDTTYQVKHQVGIDSSELFVARTGIRGANDLVWVGRAANYAAKLSARSGPPTQIAGEVYDQLNRNSKFGTNGQDMWQAGRAREIGNVRIYTSDWHWSV